MSNRRYKCTAVADEHSIMIFGGLNQYSDEKNQNQNYSDQNQNVYVYDDSENYNPWDISPSSFNN